MSKVYTVSRFEKLAGLAHQDVLEEHRTRDLHERRALREAASPGDLVGAMDRLDSALSAARNAVGAEETAEAKQWIMRAQEELEAMEEVLAGLGVLDPEWWKQPRSAGWAAKWDSED